MDLDATEMDGHVLELIDITMRTQLKVYLYSEEQGPVETSPQAILV